MIFATATSIRDIYLDSVALTSSSNGVIHHQPVNGEPWHGWELGWTGVSHATRAAIDAHYDAYGAMLTPFSYWPRNGTEVKVIYDGPPSISNDSNGAASMTVRVIQLLAS